MMIDTRNRFLLLALIITCQLGTAQIPQGFSDQLFTDEITSAVGIAFVDTQLLYVWEQDGMIEIFDQGEKSSAPLLDIHEEVSGTADHGMLGLALHPEFKRNGLLYISYVVDPHYLRYFGTPEYMTELLQTWDATIARVTRYQVDTSTFKSIVPGSRKILIGDSITNGIPVLAPAHGIGGMDFGTDSTLIIGTGDGTTWVGSHTGGTDYKEFGFDSLGKVLGIIDNSQDFGSLRAQLLHSYSGKILRIDPLTGLGIPSNPFYDSSSPNGVQSKIWSLGLRSPFRLRVKPGSGANDRLLGNPGIIIVGDVGSNKFEEINMIDGPAQNLGWPLYEGMNINPGYYSQWVENPFAPNTMFSDQCSLPYYRFNDLLVPDRRDHLVMSAHPCDSSIIINDHLVFVHKQPLLSYGNSVNNPLTVHLPNYDNKGIASFYSIDDSLTVVKGQNFDGISSVAGDFYTGTLFPEEYQNSYFHGDFGGWIKNIKFKDNAAADITAIDSFLTNGPSVVFLKFNPFDESLYYVVLDYRDRPNVYQIRRISYGENPKPIAVISVDTMYGYSPLTIALSARESYDPQNETTTNSWYFNGELSGHFIDTIITLESTVPTPTNYQINLVVADAVGQIDSVEQLISLNNTPPQVQITSLPDSGIYTPGKNLLLVNLEANYADAEQDNDQLRYFWEIKLKHNDHFHVEYTDTLSFSETQLVPLSTTQFDKHSYLISVTVTDPLGLTGYDEVTLSPDLSTGISEADITDPAYLIYPNPAQNLVYIKLLKSDLNQLYRASLYDMTGKKIRTISLESSPAELTEISLHDMRPGFYLITIEDSHQIIGRSKLIVE
jgi:glucose/arabinose dehydrogenase